MLVSHGELSKEVFNAGKMIIGELDGVQHVCLKNEDGIEALQKDFVDSLEKLSYCKGVLIMCDIQGGSPYNVSVRYALDKKYASRIRIVAGLNLPMYLSAIEYRDRLELEELVERAVQSGKSGVIPVDLNLL
jgi:mannose/fructose/sorbose-specific phosphotransferase system IIA component